MKQIVTYLIWFLAGSCALTVAGFLFVVDRAFPTKQARSYEQFPIPPNRGVADIGSFIRVPGGEVNLGAPDDASIRFSELLAPWITLARPRQSVIVSPFEIGKYEVTAQEFCEFLNSTASPAETSAPYIVIDSFATILHSDTGYEPKASYEHAPAVNVTYQGARRYCEWLTERTGVKHRLPSEIEWEYVARGRKESTYPWGEEDPRGRAFLFQHYEDELHRSAPRVVTVGSFPAGENQDGVNDLIGNASEWCGNYWFDYDDANDLASLLLEPDFAEPALFTTEHHLVIRGGHYVTPIDAFTGWTRIPGGFPLEAANLGVGFRLVRETHHSESPK